MGKNLKDNTEVKAVSKPKPEKKAVAYIDSKAILELLKMPYRIELVSLEFPSKDGKVKIVLKGEPLPVAIPKGKGSGPLPEVTYKILRHWHNASVAAKG